jgi:NAD(P)-dependent dehydrogenase (short-subunit alcohol dehydrogenase family)
MDSSIRFDNQVAIVTGGAGGIGRAHSFQLAARGASVVVNDIGTSVNGQGGDDGSAHKVVDEIIRDGGSAILSSEDCSTPEGGKAIVDLAIATFGRVDMLCHTAGIVMATPFAEVSPDDVRRLIDIHLMAAWFVGQPAWRQMVRQNYGRIVLTGSGAIFGHPQVGPYAAAKMGLIGLAHSLCQEAISEDLNIKTNVVCPIAATRMAREAQTARWGDMLGTDEVSAVVAYLLSNECPVSGEVLHAGGTHFCRIFLGQSDGWALGRPGLTPELVREHFSEGMNVAQFEIPETTNRSTDLLFRRATGHDEAFASSQILPDEVARTSLG